MKKVLIIEDDELIARVYEATYLAAGYETKAASDGAEGLELLKTFEPDLVHLDLGVPTINGVEIIKHIRRQPELKSLPVVVLSNTYQNRLVKAAIDAGATECVSKATCTPKMMLQILERLHARMSGGPVATPSEASLEPAPSASSSPRTAPVSGSAQGSETERHAAFQAEIRNDFLKRAPEMLSALRAGFDPFRQAETEASRVQELSLLCSAAHKLEGHAAIAGMQELSQVSSALVALLRDLLDRPEEITPSSLRTVAEACDFLAVLFKHSADAPSEATMPAVALVVDDEIICRRAVCQALARLSVATISVDDPQVAQRLLAENRFSLIFLDVEMPGMSGLDLCRDPQRQTANAMTPVIFVTSLADPESRERLLEAGGADVIVKPFLPMELAMKALTLLHRRQTPAQS